MKRLIFTLSMVTLISFGTYAQGVSGGLKAGVNLADLKGDTFDDYDMKVGFHVGGFVNIAFSDALSVQPELLFNTTGGKYSEDGYEEQINLTYISVPVMLMYSFGTVNIQAGPQFSFLTKAEYKEEFDGDSETIDIKDDLKGSDLGFNIGLGANFGKINASARYCIGLSNVADIEDVEAKNAVIQISLGVKLFGE